MKITNTLGTLALLASVVACGHVDENGNTALYESRDVGTTQVGLVATYRANLDDAMVQALVDRVKIVPMAELPDRVTVISNDSVLSRHVQLTIEHDGGSRFAPAYSLDDEADVVDLIQQLKREEAKWQQAVNQRAMPGPAR